MMNIEPCVSPGRAKDWNGALIYIRAKEVDLDLAEQVMEVYYRIHTGERAARLSAECLRGCGGQGRRENRPSPLDILVSFGIRLIIVGQY